MVTAERAVAGPPAGEAAAGPTTVAPAGARTTWPGVWRLRLAGLLLVGSLLWSGPWLLGSLDLDHPWLALPFLGANLLAMFLALVTVVNNWERVLPAPGRPPARGAPRGGAHSHLRGAGCDG